MFFGLLYVWSTCIYMYLHLRIAAAPNLLCYTILCYTYQGHPWLKAKRDTGSINVMSAHYS